MVGAILTGKTRMEFAYIVEDLEGKVEILLVGNHQYKTFWVEVLRPWFD